MFPVLNWKELHALTKLYAPLLEGAYLERVIVPQRKEFPKGHIRGEWAMRFRSFHADQKEQALLIGMRSQKPYLSLLGNKGPKSSQAAPRSGFHLALQKHLKGSRLLKIDPLEQERILIFWFSHTSTNLDESDLDEAAPPSQLALILSLIPATPEAILGYPESPSSKTFKIIARSNQKKATRDEDARWEPPTLPSFTGGTPSKNLPLREELFQSPLEYTKAVREALFEEAFGERIKPLQRTLRSEKKLFQKRIKQSETTLNRSQNEPDWQHYGDLLKAVFHAPPEIEKSPDSGEHFREVFDYLSEKKIQIPADPKLNPQDQLKKYYHQAKRNKRREKESTERLSFQNERLQKILQMEEKLNAIESSTEMGRFEELEKMESSLGIQNASQPASASIGKKRKTWPGRTFQSKDGRTIWVGKSRTENHDLTFHYAKGNDIWMHVRGRPGAHAVIPLPSKQSAPLDTLLDAAQLLVHYCGGENWGKTEVDYTFKKHVRKIKDSHLVQYAQEKTLLVEPDPERLNRLLKETVL
jgi:predicted ribosome quality control (RQC) complex YloA/Tae2 family protein